MSDVHLPDNRPRPGPLGRLAGFAFRRRGAVIVTWLVGLGVAIGLSSAFGADLATGFALPGSDSKHAQELLERDFPAQSGDRVDVVVRSDDVTSVEVRDRVGALLGQLDGLPHVAEVGDPYTVENSVSPDGRTLVARVYLDVANPSDMPIEDTERLLAAAEAADGDGMEIALAGGTVQQAEGSSEGTEAIGLVAAAVILLITFGSLVAAGLPLVTAIGGLLVSSSLVGLVAAFVDVPDFAPLLGAMLGIAIGIDYALLMVTRFREWRAMGLDPETATVATLDTAGRAVLVAGCTVIVSMCGLFAMGMSIMNGTAVVSMVAVLAVMLASITLFPAFLGYFGKRIDRLRLPVGRRRAEVAADGHLVPAVGWVRWSRLVQRHSVVATLGSVVVLVVMALPILGAQFAIPDAGSEPKGSSSRTAYDLLADGFGKGTSGPLLVVADLTRVDDAALGRLQADLEAAPGVAAVAPPQVSSGGAAYVGGRTATSIDTNDALVDRLPLLIGGVVLVSMLILLTAFRSIMIALTAAVMNLLSVAAAYGVLAFFLEGGWAGNLIGIDSAAPIAGYVPVIMFALLFGLSMDYEVFLISRMSESWVRSRDNNRAILAGLAGTGRVITAAASIMIVVFASLIVIDNVTMKSFGVGMVAAILIDATLVRMLLVPAVMQLLGRANWWLPPALDRWVPQLHIEGHATDYLPAPLPHSEADQLPVEA